MAKSDKDRSDLELLASLLRLDPRELLERRTLDDRTVGAFVRTYASAPEVAELDTRSTFREDSAIASLTDILSSASGDIDFVDLCCGVGTLGRRILDAIPLQAKRIHYIAVDRDSTCVEDVRAAKETSFSKFKNVTVLQREILDLGGVPLCDLVVLNNTLHELSAHTFPNIFATLNNALRPKTGRIALVDMEELPSDAPESIAITWTASEITAVLTAAGFANIVTHHEKTVGVYRADIRHTATPLNAKAMLASVERLLVAKLVTAIDTRRRIRITSGSPVGDLKAWILNAGFIARLAEEINAVQATTAKLAP